MARDPGGAGNKKRTKKRARSRPRGDVAELRSIPRAAPPPSQSQKQAVIWAAEQNILPWDVPRRPVPKRKTELQEQLQIKREALRRGPTPYLPGRAPAPAPLPLRRTPLDTRYQLAKRAQVPDEKGRVARKALAATLAPTRAKELRRDIRLPPPEPGWLPSKAERGKMFGGWNPIRQFSGDFDYLARIGRKYSDGLYDALLDEEQQEDVSETIEAGLGTTDVAATATGKFLGELAESGVETSAKKTAMGYAFDEATSNDIAEVTGNFVRNLSEGIVGFVPGIAVGATHPLRMAGQIGDFYREFYGPLFNGNVDGFLANLKENPDMLLDFLGWGGVVGGTGRRVATARRAARNAGLVDSGPARAAVRGLVQGKEPIQIGRSKKTNEPVYRWGKRTHTRYHRLDGQQTSTQMYVPQGAIGLALADLAQKGRQLAERTGGQLPSRFGKTLLQYPVERRFRKGVREDIEATRSRVFGEIQAFRASSRRVEADPTRAKAFDRMLIHGGDAALVADRIRREILVRQREGHNETQAEIDEIARLEQAANYLDNPDSDFLRVVEQGRAIAVDTEQVLKDAGVLHPRTAERMLLTPLQFLEDVPTEIDSPTRDKIQTLLRKVYGEGEGGVDHPQVQLGLRYLDANAISWARRNDSTPEQFYETVYSDASYAKTGDVYDVLGQPGMNQIFLQRGDVTPFLISEANNRRHRVAAEELRGVHGEERRLAAEERAKPKHGARITTIKQRFDRILRQLHDPGQRLEVSRWYKDIWPVFEDYFGTDSADAVRAFLASQAATSPADGLLNLLKALEYKNVHGVWPEAGKLGLNTESIVRAWNNVHLGEDPAGIAAKLSDFYDSAMGKSTRTWLRDTLNSAPGVVDRWTLRSDGFLDFDSYGYSHGSLDDPRAPNPNELEKLNDQIKDLREIEATKGLSRRKRTELRAMEAHYANLREAHAEYYDMSGAPDPYQYEWSSMRLQDLQQRFNDERIDGRDDWAVDEVQAMDWFATRQEWGVFGGGWDDTFGRNTYGIVGEVTGELTREWLKQGEAGAYVQKVATAGPHASIQILGSPGAAAHMAQRLADESGNRAYHFYDQGGSEARGRVQALAIDIVGNDPEAAYNGLAHVVGDAIDDGILVLPYGDGGLRIVFRDPDGKALRYKKERGGYAPAQREKLLADLNDLGVNASAVNTRMEVFHGRQRPVHRLYRGVDPRGVLARAAALRRRGAEFRVSEVADQRGVERLLAGLSRNSRAWSIDPRAADDFLERGFRGFLTDDGNAGVAISPDGEIASLFNSGSSTGAGAHVLVEALAQGGYWLNVFDGYVPAYLANLGFREVGRVKFDRTKAPPGWNPSHGRPDTVFMAYAPHRPVRRGKVRTDLAKAETAAKKLGKEGLAEYPIEKILEELANRGDGIPHILSDGEVLMQWSPTLKTTTQDPKVAGAVKLTDDGVHVAFTPSANFSTLVHENAHAMLGGALEWLRQGDDPRLENLQDMLRIEDVDNISEGSQELFARAVEAWVYLGRAPSVLVRQVMDESSTLMQTLYSDGIEQIARSGKIPKARLERLLKSTDFTSLLDDLHDVTYGVTREHNAVFMPRLSPVSPNRVYRTMQRVSKSITRSAITPMKTKPVRTGNKNIRFESGVYRYGPDVIADYATSAFRYQVANELARQIMHDPYVRKLEPNEQGVYAPLPGYRLFVYKATPGAARVLDEALGMAAREDDVRGLRAGDPHPAADLEPQELANTISEEAGRAFAAVFPTATDQFSPVELDQLIKDNAIVQIPDHVHQAYVDAVSGTALLSLASEFYNRDLGLIGQALGTPFAILNVMSRWNMIGKGAYMFTNTVGAAATATMHNPFWLGEIRKSTDYLSNWSPASLRALDEMVHAGSFDITQILEDETRFLTKAGRIERDAFVKAQSFMSWPERRIRRMLMSRELRAAGYATEQDFLMLRDLAASDPHYQAIYNQLSRNAEDGAIRFRGMTDTEKWIVRRAFFVYGWLRASLRYTLRFPLNHPIQAAVMNAVGREGWENLQEWLEREIGFRGGLPIKMTDTEEERLATMSDLSGILPFASGAQVMRSILAPPISMIGGHLDADAIGNMFTPGVELGVAIALGETPQHQTPGAMLAETFGPAEGFKGVPALNWIMRFNDPKLTETTTFAPRTRKDVAISFFLGQVWPREHKLDAAQDAWLKRQPTEISAPIRAQMEEDKFREALDGALKADGEPMLEEWNLAISARSGYDLASRMRTRELRGMEEEERNLERAKMKVQVMKQFFPEVVDGLRDLPDDYTVEETVSEVDREWEYWVGSQYTDMRDYIEEVLGAEKVPD